MKARVEDLGFYDSPLSSLCKSLPNIHTSRAIVLLHLICVQDSYVMMGVPLNVPDADEIQPECFAYEERQVERLLRQSQRCNVHSKAFSSSSSSDMMQARQTALEELTQRFSSLDYRDEWLVAATWLVDRAFSVAAGSAAQRQDSANPAACAGDIYKSKPFWLGAVLMMVKMYGADTELDSDLKDIMMPLLLDWPRKPFEESGASQTRTERMQNCWNEMVKVERRICTLLDNDLLVPTPLPLLQALAAVISKAGEGSSWSGFEKCEISLNRGSSRAKKPAKALPVTRVEALAGLLVELGLMRRPAEVYGSSQGAQVLAFAAMHVSLLSFFEELPDYFQTLQAPKACISALARLQSHLLSEEEVHKLPCVSAILHRLWHEADTKSCPVLRKWARRGLGLGIKLPKPTCVVAEDLSVHEEPLSQTPPCRHSLPATSTPVWLTPTKGKNQKVGRPLSMCSIASKMMPPLAKSKVQALPPLQSEQKSESLAQPRTELAQRLLKRRRTDDEPEQLAPPRCSQQTQAKPAYRKRRMTDDEPEQLADPRCTQQKAKLADRLASLSACQKNEHSHDQPPCAPLPVLSQRTSPKKLRRRKQICEGW